ncbi:MAG: hypothetical protein ACW964_03495 [Candidatus Hodarchaeales archaeon]|jgi:hypothetical protein
MVSRSYRCLLIIVIAFSVINSVFSNSIVLSTQDSLDYSSKSVADQESLENAFPMIEFQLPKAIAQNDTTNATTTTTTTTSDETTNDTDTKIHSPWESPFVNEDLYYPLALLFSVLGIFSVLWLIFFVETSKERTIRERIIGSAIRLVIMSLLLGFALHYWILFEPI